MGPRSDVRIAGYPAIHAPPAAPASDVPVLFVHGIMGSHEDSRPFVDFFSTAGFDA